MLGFGPIALGDSPATFATAQLGITMIDPSNGKEYQLLKNTDASSLASGKCLTLETPGSWYADICTGNEYVYGVVPNDYTGKVVAVNDMFWVQRRGMVYCGKGLATGSAAVAIDQPLVIRTGGNVKAHTGTVGSKSFSVHKNGARMIAQSAVASSATTQVLVLLT